MSAPITSPNSREPPATNPTGQKAIQRVIRQANGHLRVVSAPVGVAANGNILINTGKAPMMRPGMPLQARVIGPQAAQKSTLGQLLSSPRLRRILIFVRNLTFLIIAITFLNMIASRAGPLPAVIAAFVMYKGGMFIFIESAVLGLKGALNTDEAAYEMALRRADSMRAPVTKKEGSASQKGPTISFGFSCMQGWRRSMEDAHTMILDGVPNHPLSVETPLGGRIPTAATLGPITQEGPVGGKGGFFAVFDGHCGQRVANYCSEHLYHFVTKSPAWAAKNYRQALIDGFVEMDQHIYLNHPDERSGCTAVAVLISEDGKKIYCANAGDSRAILGQSVASTSLTSVEPLSDDHKPYNRGEQLRIQKAGSVVFNKRVNGILALSRAIGDFNFKKNKVLPWVEQAVTCIPDVREIDIDLARDDFIVLACDGIWDVRNNEDVAAFVRQRLQRKVPLHTICEQLMQACLSPRPFGNGCDNMSVIVLTLDGSAFMKSVGGPSTGATSPAVRAASPKSISSTPLKPTNPLSLPAAISLDFASADVTVTQPADQKNESGSKRVTPPPPLFFEKDASQTEHKAKEESPNQGPDSRSSTPSQNIQIASPSGVNRGLGFGFPAAASDSPNQKADSTSDTHTSSHSHGDSQSRANTAATSLDVPPVAEDETEISEEEQNDSLALQEREQLAGEDHEREVAEALCDAKIFSPKTPPSLHFDAVEEREEEEQEEQEATEDTE